MPVQFCRTKTADISLNILIHLVFIVSNLQPEVRSVWRCVFKRFDGILPTTPWWSCFRCCVWARSILFMFIASMLTPLTDYREIFNYWRHLSPAWMCNFHSNIIRCNLGSLLWQPTKALLNPHSVLWDTRCSATRQIETNNPLTYSFIHKMNNKFGVSGIARYKKSDFMT